MTENREKREKKETHLRLLNEFSTRLQSLIHTEESFYQKVVDLIQEKLNYYSLMIFSVDEDGSATLRAQAGAYSTHLEVGHTLASDTSSITHYVIRTKKSYLSDDVSQDPHFTNLSLPVSSRSELCVPILKENEVLGVLNVESDELQGFDADDVITMEAVASQVAVAMNNRNLFLEVKEFNETLQEKVNEKTRKLTEAQERILEQQKLLKKENKALKTLVNKDKEESSIIGHSEATKSLLTMVDKIAPTSATVLIQGESGTGKELIARRLHQKSKRHDKPFVTVNCGALQESLLESELFGHEKGAFTGANQQKIGLVETADEGTLFLDEIGELSLGIQSKLLRFLQEGEFFRIGGKRPIKVNVRMISATNKDLEAEVKKQQFREDLYYRLNTITLHTPPLRKRKEDIPQLIDYFLKQRHLGGSPTEPKKLDSKVLEVLMAYDWPGNIRELQNTIERLKILGEGNEICLDDIPFEIRMPRRSQKEQREYTVEMSLEEVEKNHIMRTLSYHRGNKTRCAQSLGITIKTLYNKLHRYGMLSHHQNEQPQEQASQTQALA